jgi:hypothetical protein
LALKLKSKDLILTDSGEAEMTDGFFSSAESISFFGYFPSEFIFQGIWEALFVVLSTFPDSSGATSSFYFRNF